MAIKMMLKTCLITGIIAFSIISCTKTDYVNESEWRYVNHTDKTIQITYGDGSFDSEDMNFVLSPNATYSFVISSYSTNPDISADDYDSPYSIHGATISIDGIDTIFYPGKDCSGFSGRLESICDIKEYAAVKNSKNHYRFSFEFNND